MSHPKMLAVHKMCVKCLTGGVSRNSVSGGVRATDIAFLPDRLKFRKQLSHWGVGGARLSPETPLRRARRRPPVSNSFRKVQSRRGEIVHTLDFCPIIILGEEGFDPVGR